MASIGIGERLRSARQALGLSLEEIESITHIRRSYLDALEREAFDVLPGPSYVRGFLRAYAGCLGLPPQDLLDQFPAAAAREVPQRDSPVEVRITPAVRLSPVRRAMMGVGLLVVLGVLFIGFVLYTQLREFASTAPAGTPSARGGAPRSPTPPPTAARPGGAPPPVAPKPAASPAPPAPAGSPPGTRPATAPAPSVSPAPPAPAAPPAASRPSPPPPPTQPPPAKPVAPPPAPAAPGPAAPAPGAGSAASTPAAAPGTPPAPAPPAAPSPTAPLNMTIAASGHTWVRGVADGATVFEGFMNAGDKQIWQAKHSLTIRVGNAAAMNIAVNGKPMGPLGNAGQVYEHTFSAGAP